MNPEKKGMMLIAGTVIVVMAFAFIALFAYSGMSSPLTVVRSGSMQHSENSQLNVIDTGDMVVMRSVDKAQIITYVEGYKKGYQKFGMYGDVIIYHRDTGNPVIHRAMLWLDYDKDTGIWSAPSLKDYPDDMWSVTTGDYNDLNGILELYIEYNNDERISCKIDLDNHITDKHSGFLTKGDNVETNGYFDQGRLNGVNGLISMDRIKAVAGVELPWIGCVKLLFNNKDVNNIPDNSIPCLIVMFIDVIMFIITLSVIIDVAATAYKKRNIG